VRFANNTTAMGALNAAREIIRPAVQLAEVAVAQSGSAFRFPGDGAAHLCIRTEFAIFDSAYRQRIESASSL
jgi:hypothetical protein